MVEAPTPSAESFEASAGTADEADSVGTPDSDAAGIDTAAAEAEEVPAVPDELAESESAAAGPAEDEAIGEGDRTARQDPATEEISDVCGGCRWRGADSRARN